MPITQSTFPPRFNDRIEAFCKAIYEKYLAQEEVKPKPVESTHDTSKLEISEDMDLFSDKIQSTSVDNYTPVTKRTPRKKMRGSRPSPAKEVVKKTYKPRMVKYLPLSMPVKKGELVLTKRLKKGMKTTWVGPYMVAHAHLKRGTLRLMCRDGCILSKQFPQTAVRRCIDLEGEFQVPKEARELLFMDEDMW